MVTNRRYGTGMIMLNEFAQYLIDQIGQPYVWGGQHTKLTPDNYETVIRKKETTPKKADEAIAYCKKLFDAGAEVLYAYDCSGLGMYWLQNVKGIYKSDMNANSMMHKCVDLDTPEPPELGWWCFKMTNGRATHIGYMVDDTHVVEAKGRSYGVTKSVWREKDWNCWGIPKCFEDEIRHPEPQPDPPEPDPPELKWYVEVLGNSVRVRKKDNKLSRTVFIAHKGDLLPYVGPAPSGWYKINSDRGDGYITNKEKYTKLVEL